jgi:queuine tRNA-ribosyltransferase
LSTQKYAEYVRHLKPDVTIALGDVPYGPLPGKKRASKMAERSGKWVDSLVEELKDELTSVWAPVLPRDLVTQLDYVKHIASDVAPKLDGLAIYSSELLPEIEEKLEGDAKSNWIRLARLSLDEEGNATPQAVLSQISLGIDVFALPFIGNASDSGLALTFEFPAPKSDAQLPLAVDLSLTEHATSVTPLSEGCTCPACSKHHRAYIRHLLHAREMLAWTLLSIHNTHAATRFFANIRASIQNGRFIAEKARFEEVYGAVGSFPEGAEGPRRRGYHGKSDGKEEGSRRNRPAWGDLEGVKAKEVAGEGGEAVEKVGEAAEALLVEAREGDVEGLAEKVEKL